MSGADSRIEPIAALVESAMSVNRMLPRIKYRGKFSISPPNLRMLLNTATKTHIMSKGLSTDQRTPRTLRRYFSLKSFEIRDMRINQLRFVFSKVLAACAIKFLGVLYCVVRTPICLSNQILPQRVFCSVLS